MFHLGVTCSVAQSHLEFWFFFCLTYTVITWRFLQGPQNLWGSNCHLNSLLQHEVSILKVTVQVNIIQRGEVSAAGSHYPQINWFQLQSIDMTGPRSLRKYNPFMKNAIALLQVNFLFLILFTNIVSRWKTKLIFWLSFSVLLNRNCNLKIMALGSSSVHQQVFV